jgi:hypothetical protein
MQANGVGPDQVTQVRGFADQRLRTKDPLDPANRRVSVIVHYLPSSTDQENNPNGEDSGGAGEAKTGEAKGDNEKSTKPSAGTGSKKPDEQKALPTESPAKKE